MRDKKTFTKEQAEEQFNYMVNERFPQYEKLLKGEGFLENCKMCNFANDKCYNCILANNKNNCCKFGIVRCQGGSGVIHSDIIKHLKYLVELINFNMELVGSDLQCEYYKAKGEQL